MSSYFFSNITYVNPNQKIEKKTNLLIHEGKVQPNISESELNKISSLTKIAGDGLVALPGFFDIATRAGEPGFEVKETFESVSRAALSGGYTSLACSPLSNPINDSPYLTAYINEKTNALNLCRFFPLASLTKKSEGEELSEIGLLTEAGVLGFLDDDQTIMNSYVMKKLLEYLKKFECTMIAYCEDQNLSHKTAIHEGAFSNILGLRGSPSAAEEIIVARDIALCRLTGTPIHFIKISAKSSLKLIRSAKKEGLPISASTSIAHLYLCDEDVKSFDTNLKTNPPLRTREDLIAISDAILDGTIDFIVSDHNPQGDLQKSVEFDLAEAGMSTIEYTSSLFIDWAIKNKLSYTRIAEALSTNPARLLLKSKSNNYDLSSDFVIFSPNEKWTLTKELMLSKSKNTAFLNRELKGKVLMTFVKGKLKYEKN